MPDLPSFVRTSRKQALEHGAALIEREIQGLRAQALHADGHPYDAQYEIDPTPRAERIMLETLELATSAAILREMARAEA